MRLNFTRFFAPLLLSGSIFAAQSTYAQDVIFSESMGGTDVSSGTAISAHTFQNSSVAALSYSGTGDVRSTSASSTAHYSTASGGNNIMLNANTENFNISGIDIEDFSDIVISFGLRKSTSAEDGSNFALQIYVDGILVKTFVPSLPSGSGTASSYHFVTTSITNTGSEIDLNFVRTGGTGSNPEFRIDDVSITATPDPMSVNLLSFNVTNENNARVFSWVTAQEKELSHFELEASTNGKEFKVINSVMAKNAWEGAQYSVTSTANDNYSFFRLKSVDFDGTYAYSKVVMIDNISDNKVSILNTVSSSDITIKSPKNATFTIINVAGIQVMTGRLMEGVNIVDISNLPAGNFIFHADGESVRIIKN